MIREKWQWPIFLLHFKPESIDLIRLRVDWVVVHFAPGATGNVATEDVVHMLDTLGIETGIDVKKVCEAVR